MFDKMKQLMELKKQADQIKKQLDAVSVDISDVRGIKISINGSQHFNSIDIDPSLLTPENKKRFEGELLRSLNLAVRKSQEVAAIKMKDVMPGLSGFPGL